MSKALLKVLLGIGSVGLVVALIVGLRTRPDIAPVQGARSLLSLPGTQPNYWWLDNDNLLLLRERNPVRFVRYRVRDNEETPLPELSNRFTQSNGLPETLRVSNDGRYLLWSAKDKKRTLIARVDGSEYQETVHSKPTISFWQRGSRFWMGFGITEGRFAGGDIYNREAKGQKVSSRPLSSTYFLEPTETIGASYDGTNVSRAMITESGQFMAQLWKGAERPVKTAVIGIAGLTASPMGSNLIKSRVPHPENEGAEVFFSPDEAWMGWIVKFREPLVYDLGMRSSSSKAYFTGLWITDRKTDQTTCLGYLPTRRDDPASGPYNVQFTPTGNGISYVYNNTLYLLPISH